MRSPPPKHDRAAPEALTQVGRQVGRRRQVEGEGVALGPGVAHQVREALGQTGQPRLDQLLDAVGRVLGRYHLGVQAPADERGRVRRGGLGVLEPAHAHADLGALGEGDRVGVVGLAAEVHQPEVLVPGEAAAQAEAGLDLVEHQRHVVVAGQQPERPEEARGGVAVAALGLHRLDDAGEVRPVGERPVDHGQRRDLGGQQRIVVGVAEARGQGRRGRRCRRRRSTRPAPAAARRWGSSTPGTARR